MQVRSMEFKARAGQKLADKRLQQNLTKLSTKFVTARAVAIQDIDFPATREALKERRNRALDNLDVWLATFEAEATRRGARSSLPKPRPMLRAWLPRSPASTT